MVSFRRSNSARSVGSTAEAVAVGDGAIGCAVMTGGPDDAEPAVSAAAPKGVSAISDAVKVTAATERTALHMGNLVLKQPAESETRRRGGAEQRSTAETGLQAN